MIFKACCITKLVLQFFEIIKNREARIIIMPNKPTYQELEKRVQELETALDDIEQKKPTDALHAGRRRFKELIKNSSDSIVILNKDGIQTYVSDAVEKHLGFKPHEVVNISVIEKMIHPDDQQKTLAAFTKIIEEGEGGVQYRHRHKNGSWVYFEARGTNQLDNPDIKGVVLNVRDITERKHVEDALKKSEEIFRVAFQTSPNAITLTTIKDGIYVDINDAFSNMLGYSKKDVIGKSSLVLNIWNDVQDRDLLASALKKHGLVKNLEAEFKGKNGQIISGLMSACILDIENRRYLLAITQDITEKKEADQTIRLMKYGVDRASDCIFWMNSKAYFIFVNNAACNLSGYSNEELLSMNLNQIDKKVILDAWPDRLAKLKHVKSYKFESQLSTRDGQLIPVEIISSYVLFEGAESIFSFVHDISERKKAQQARIKAQQIAGEHEKLALVGQIAGKMAHDFNNILAIIMGNAELALLNCKEEKTIQILGLIFNQTIRGKKLTKNLVVFANDQEPKHEFFRLSEKIDLVFNLLKKDLLGIEQIKEYTPGVPDLLADPGMIEHAFVNLVQNSIHATSMVEQPKIVIRTFHIDKNIYIEIEDNGCGIPKEALDRIYEPAFTMKGSSDVRGSYRPGIKGTGYGMANVKKYIEQHRGNISIDSEIDKGTKITINLPVIKKELTHQETMEIQK